MCSGQLFAILRCFFKGFPMPVLGRIKLANNLMSILFWASWGGVWIQRIASSGLYWPISGMPWWYSRVSGPFLGPPSIGHWNTNSRPASSCAVSTALHCHIGRYKCIKLGILDRIITLNKVYLLPPDLQNVTIHTILDGVKFWGLG